MKTKQKAFKEYRNALRSGEKQRGLSKLIADKNNISDSTLRSWIKRDRDKGRDWNNLSIADEHFFNKSVAPKKESVAKDASKKVELIKRDNEDIFLGLNLNEKQKRFVEEYLIDLNATQAATRAGYSKNTAKQQGSRLLSHAVIQIAIDRGIDARSQRTGITADRVLNEIAAIGFSKITDYLEVKEVEIVVGYEDGEDGKPDKNKPIIQQTKVVDIFQTSKMNPEKIQAIESIKQTKDGITLKLYDKVKSLELLGKHLKMFTDKVQHTGEVDETIRISIGDEEF